MTRKFRQFEYFGMFLSLIFHLALFAVMVGIHPFHSEVKSAPTTLKPAVKQQEQQMQPTHYAQKDRQPLINSIVAPIEPSHDFPQMFR